MQGARKTIWVLVASLLAAATGCHYRVEHYGYTREFGIGKVGCAVATPRPHTIPVPRAPASPQEQVISIETLPAGAPATVLPQTLEAVVVEQPHDVRAGPVRPSSAVNPKVAQSAASSKGSDVLTRILSILPKLDAPAAGQAPPVVPRSRNAPAPAPPAEKSWVGLPNF
ncbi:MAG: hypothetical protein L0Y71_06760 [Gemmataceae bacterium]|nr:hypothetical protein [Gemmataceae bacterium]